MENQRVYFVIDMKSFFASVECAERGLDAMTTKLVVADETRKETTICLAVSPKLKAMGIKNRCRLFEIPKTIDFIIAPPRMKKYIDYAANIYAIYLKYIDKSDIHVYSIDECFLDVTDYLKIYKKSAKEFAQMLMQEIEKKLHIPSTVGIGTNLYLAKIALDITAKTSKTRIGWLNEEKYIKELIHHKPLTDFWQISTGTVERLNKLGIDDMFGISVADENKLYREFGVNAELLIDHSKGKESCLLSDIKNYKTSSKSISQSQILPCNYNFNDARIVLKEMIQNGCYELVKLGYVTQLIHIYVSYGDARGDVDKKTKRMNVITNLNSIISQFAIEAFNEVANKGRPIRKLGYSFNELMPQSSEQYDFFTDIGKIKKEKKLVQSVLCLQNKFGKNAVLKGLDLTEKATQIERNKMIGGHKDGEN